MTATGAIRTDSRSPWQVARYWARRAVMMEVRGYLSVARYVLRRPRVPRDAQPFTYHQLVMPLLVAFIVVSAIELVVVDVLVRRWESVRVGMLVLGIWGLVYMVGLLFGFLTRPHAVGPDGLALRSGAELDLRLGWEDVTAVRRHKRGGQGKQARVSVDDHGRRTLHLHVQNELNVLVELRNPVIARLPRGPETISRIELYVDDPDAFVAAARAHGPSVEATNP